MKFTATVALAVPARVYRCLNGLAPSYLASDLQRVADIDAPRRLRSASTSTLVVPATCLSTVGDRAFPVAAARVWNSLPADMSLRRHHCRHSRDGWRQNCLLGATHSSGRVWHIAFYCSRCSHVLSFLSFHLVSFFPVKCPSSLWYYATLISFVQ